jgi:hypothetical protein
MQATLKGIVKGAFVGKRRERREKRKKFPFKKNAFSIGELTHLIRLY